MIDTTNSMKVTYFTMGEYVSSDVLYFNIFILSYNDVSEIINEICLLKVK